jgi:steroid delta-isomerase-like uncharacterized protein
MSEENKALARRSWEIVDNLDTIEEIYAPDVGFIDAPDLLIRLVPHGQFVTTYKTALPDLNITVEDVVGEGDKAVTRWTVRGTHQGEVEEFGPPTGRQVELKGITIHRIDGGKIVEEWEAYDNLSILQQLGLVPEHEQASS